MKPMSKKMYFSNDSGFCESLELHREFMKENNLDEMVLFEAKRETGTGYFFCKKFGEFGETKDCCGKQCSIYKPNNKISGRCKHYGFCYYEQTENKFLLRKEKKLLKII